LILLVLPVFRPDLPCRRFARLSFYFECFCIFYGLLASFLNAFQPLFNLLFVVKMLAWFINALVAFLSCFS